MKPRRILVAHPVPGLYGADRMMLAAMQVLAADGDELTFVVPETGPLLPLVERAGIKTRLFGFPVLRKALVRPTTLVALSLAAPWEVAKLWWLIRRESPDLVYVNTVTLPHWLVAARLAGVPSICHVREAEHGMRPAMARILLLPTRLATVLIANSGSTADWLTAHQPAVAARLRVVYNGFSFLPAEPDAPTSAHAGRIAVVGRLSPRKGQDVALEAVALLVAAGRDVELHLIGDVFRGYEWFEKQLADDADRLGLAGRMVVDGFSADPTASYLDAAIVLVPSRLEPFGNVAVEAMAVGRPVVATRVGGLPEIVDNGRTGLLCPPDDAPALARAIATLLDDAALAQRLATAGARSVRERFGMPRFGAELRSAVAAALGAGKIGLAVRE